LQLQQSKTDHSGIYFKGNLSKTLGSVRAVLVIQSRCIPDTLFITSQTGHSGIYFKGNLSKTLGSVLFTNVI